VAQDGGARALSDATINQLLESAPDAIVIVDLEGTIRHVNAAAERLFSYPRAALLGRSVDLLLPEALRQLHVVHRDEYAAEPRARPIGVGLELSGLRADGTQVPIEISLSPLDADGQLLVTAIVRDVTERRRAEERVRRSEARLAEAQQIAHVGSWEWEIASGELSWSDELCRIYGVDPRSFTPTFPQFLALVHPDDRERVAAIVAQAEADHQPYEFFHRIVRPDGSLRVVHARGEVILDERGAPTRMHGVGQDVTELREAQAQARQLEGERAARAEAEASQRQLALLADASAALGASLEWEATLGSVARLAIDWLAELCVIDILYDPALRPVVVAHRDPAVEERVREMRRLYPLDLTVPAPVSRVARDGAPLLLPAVSDAFLASIARDARHLEMLLELDYRSVIIVPLLARGHVLGTLMLVRHATAQPFTEDELLLTDVLGRRIAMAVDNARLYAAEQAARQEAERNSERISRLQAISAAFSRAHTPVEVEEAVIGVAQRTLGAAAGVVLVVTDDRSALQIVGSLGFDAEPNRDWPPVPLDTPLPATEVIRTGMPIWLTGHAERLRRYPALADTFTADAGASVSLPLLVDGSVVGVLGLSFREERAFSAADRNLMLTLAQHCAQALERARLAQAERAAQAAATQALNAREVFLSIAAHELKTPLTTIKAAAHLLDRRLNMGGIDDERIQKLSGQLRGEIERLERLVSDLLDVSRIQRGQLQLRREPVDLRAVAAEIMARFEDAAERKPEHLLALDAPEPVVGDWDPARLDQVLSNLLSNALKYAPNGGVVQVRVRRAGHQAVLSVSDEGIGITAEERGQLFQPFMRGDTARLTIGGTGLGLYIASEIVARHGGAIDVASTPGAGSVFTVRLPLSVPEASGR
jgi:PAS domain S-box-containing protein